MQNTVDEKAVHSSIAIVMRLRLWSGLVLMAYLVTHLANQALVLCIAWLHGCFGVHFWLRSKFWYPRLAGRHWRLCVL